MERVKRFLPRSIVQLFLLSVGIIFLVIGVIQGDALEILRKAVLVCLECIGIG